MIEIPGNLDTLRGVLKKELNEMRRRYSQNLVSGSTIGEVEDARKGSIVLGDRLDNTDAELAQKPDKIYVDTQLSSVANGTPKGAYATLTDLETAHPNGDDNNYVLQSDGHIYYWNGSSWTDTGIQYQSDGIADRSVSFTKTDFLNYGYNLFNPYTVIDGQSLSSSGVPMTDADYSLSEFIPVKQGITYIVNLDGTTIKRPAFYNGNKVFVELIFSSTSSVSIEYTAPSDGFVRIPVLITGRHNISFSDKSIQFTFIPFQVNTENYIKSMPKEQSVGEKELINHTVSIEKTNFLEKTNNLFNKKSITPNKVMTGTVISDSTIYHLSDYIPANEKETYTISPGARTIIFFDAQQNYIGNVPQAETNNENNAYTFDTGDNVAYIRVSVYQHALDTIMLSVGSSVPSFESWGVISKDLLVKYENLDNDVINYINNGGDPEVLNGKKLLNFGDSISTADFGYQEIIAEKYNMPLRDLGSGGATVAPRAGSTNQIINRVNTAITEGQAADYILFNGLTNDANVLDASLAGTITSGYDDALDLDTFAGSFENLVKTLIVNWTNAKIMYIRPHNMDSRDGRQKTYGDLALEICKKWSIPYVDMYNEGGLNTQIPELKLQYTVDTYDAGTGDGTHPNQEGYHMYYVPRIEAKMKSI